VIRVLSYGGGLDSFAMFLGALQRGDKPDVVCFVDVGDSEGRDPGEWPGTYRHIREVVIPLCDREGVPFTWLDSVAYPIRGGTDGEARSLFAWLETRGQIPVAGPARICTRIAKVERFEKWMNDRWPGQEVEVWIGFEAGEEKRAANDPNAGTGRTPKPGETVRKNRFPLIEWGMCRCRCAELVRQSGYPVPRKSACTFCPYGSKGDWQTLAAELPEVFARTAALETNKPLTKKGKKLSIMGYRTLKDKDGNETGYKAPPLAEFIKGTYKAQPKPCAVCGASQRATKATGCGYLEDPSKEEAA
jgi:hypothetical protein